MVQGPYGAMEKVLAVSHAEVLASLDWNSPPAPVMVTGTKCWVDGFHHGEPCRNGVKLYGHPMLGRSYQHCCRRRAI